MSTVLRPEVSKKNQYWIEKHRYYELKHFCLQYPIWKQSYLALDGMAKRSFELNTSGNTNCSSPVEKCVEKRLYFIDRMEMIEKATKDTDIELCDYILQAVTKGYSYDYLLTHYSIPCCKDVYYSLYRKFFWILNKSRK